MGTLNWDLQNQYLSYSKTQSIKPYKAGNAFPIPDGETEPQRGLPIFLDCMVFKGLNLVAALERKRFL